MSGENFKTFSAKDLCMRSCMQIKMFNEHPELRPKPNINTNNGVSYQHQIALETKNVIGEEMRGSYIEDDIMINFSNDIVCNNQIIEVKSVNGTPESWYFESSLLQCAVYCSLLEKSKTKKLVTASFYVQMGNKLIETKLSSPIKYYLRFGEELYLIDVNNSDEIVNFIMKKAKASLDWVTAKEFDIQYKKKEFETLKKYFNFHKVENLL